MDNNVAVWLQNLCRMTLLLYVGYPVFGELGQIRQSAYDCTQGAKSCKDVVCFFKILRRLVAIDGVGSLSLKSAVVPTVTGFMDYSRRFQSWNFVPAIVMCLARNVDSAADLNEQSIWYIGYKAPKKTSDAKPRSRKTPDAKPRASKKPNRNKEEQEEQLSATNQLSTDMLFRDNCEQRRLNDIFFKPLVEVSFIALLQKTILPPNRFP